MLALSACSSPEATVAGPANAATAEAQTPEAFVRSLYSVDSGGTGEVRLEYDGDLETISSARTAALFAEAKALTPPGYIGYPEGHPLVEYEEFGSLRLDDVVTTRHGPDRADVALVLAFNEPDTRVRRVFRLVKEEGRWRLDDMLFNDGEQSLVEGFNSYIADAKANPDG
ncbi:MAG TPA: hypothetical protein VF686_01790 [Brevundimonas sp.]